jgi:hypothetical protein
MNYRAMCIGFAAVLLFAASSAKAQSKFEITPFAGYETSASYPLTYQNNAPIDNPVDRLRVNDALSYGAFGDYNVTENFQAELMWDRNNTSYSAHQIIDGSYVKAFDSNINQFQFGGAYTFLGSEHRLRPYVAGSVGFTHDSNGAGNSNRTEFGYSLGGGVKYYISRHVGFRGDLRFMPTYGSSSYETFCYFGCYTAKVANFLNRGNFVGGIIFKF